METHLETFFDGVLEDNAQAVDLEAALVEFFTATQVVDCHVLRLILLPEVEVSWRNDGCCPTDEPSKDADNADRTAESRDFEFFEHLVLVVVFFLLGFGEQVTDLGQLLEDGRAQAEFHVVFKLSFDLDRRALISLQGFEHLRCHHFLVSSLFQQKHARGEVFQQLCHLQPLDICLVKRDFFSEHCR